MTNRNFTENDESYGNQQQYNQQQAQAQGHQNAAYGGQAPAFDAYGKFAVYSKPNGLDTAGQEFIKNLRENLADKANATPIDCIRLPEPAPLDTYFFHLDGQGVVLVFRNALTNPHIVRGGHAPGMINEELTLPLSTGLSDKAIAATKKVCPNANVLNVIIVEPEDYERLTIWTRYISNLLSMVAIPEIAAMTIDNLADIRISIDTNPARVKDFYDKFYPHAVYPRNDIGFVIRISKNTKSGYNNISSDDNSPIDIAAVSVFTDVIAAPASMQRPANMFAPQQAQPAFIPVVRHTDTFTTINHPFILQLAQALVAELYVRRGGWREQFADLTKGKANIGNLMRDTENKLMHISTRKDLDGFLNAFVNPIPLVAMDVTEGRVRVPMMHCYANPAQHEQLLKMFAQFFNLDQQSAINTFAGKSLVSAICREFTGTIKLNSMKVDSRYLDFLEVMRINADYESNMRLLSYTTDYPFVRSKFISELVPEFDMISETAVCIIGYDMLAAFIGLANKLNISTTSAFFNTDAFPGATDFTAILQQGYGSFGTMPSLGGYRNGFSYSGSNFGNYGGYNGF